jgi:hypothetical protein
VSVLPVVDDEDDNTILRDLLSGIDGGQYKLTWVTAYAAALQAPRQIPESQ